MKKELSATARRFQDEKIEAAMRQGFEICHAHYPAGIMVTTDGVNWKCTTPECNCTRTRAIQLK